MISVLLFVVAFVCVHSTPYGFRSGGFRQEDAIVVESASSMQSPSGNPTSSSVHSPSCLYRIYYNSQSSNSANTRQNNQQTYYQPARDRTNYYLANPQFRTASAESSNSYYQQRQNDVQPSNNYYQRQNDVQSSSNYFQRQNDVQSSSNYYQRQNDVQKDSGSEYAPTGSSYESFMVHQEYPTARVVMGYRQMSPMNSAIENTKSETKSLMSSYY